MTRAELRRAEREKLKSQKVYTLTQEEINKMVSASVDRIVQTKFNELLARETDKAFVVMMCLPSVAQHDTFGFGKERLTRFMDNVCIKYFSMLEDYDRRAKAGYDFDTFINILKRLFNFLKNCFFKLFKISIMLVKLLSD